MMQAFAKNSFPLPLVLSPPRLLPGQETACVLRWQAAPVSARVLRIPPIGCRRHCFGGRMAARAFSRIR